MKLKKYLNDNGIARQSFAKSINVSYGYLNQIMSGHRNAGLCIAVKIEKVTKGKVRCKDMLPVKGE